MLALLLLPFLKKESVDGYGFIRLPNITLPNLTDFIIPTPSYIPAWTSDNFTISDSSGNTGTGGDLVIKGGSGSGSSWDGDYKVVDIKKLDY